MNPQPQIYSEYSLTESSDDEPSGDGTSDESYTSESPESPEYEPVNPAAPSETSRD